MEFITRKVLEANTQGIDYYVGDLHGRLDLFEKLLVEIGFDKSKDRMISVGDLVDRGVFSQACLYLLKEPWFHAIIGNHEEMMVHNFFPNHPKYSWIMASIWEGNGGEWGVHHANNVIRRNTFEDESFELYHFIKDVVSHLPRFMTVRQPDGGNIHVVHAELPLGIHYTDENFDDEVYMHRLLNKSYDTTRFCYVDWQWKRARFYNLYTKVLTKRNIKKFSHFANLQAAMIGSSESLVISGHTIMRQPVQIGNFLNIDTGAYAEDDHWTGLSCYNSFTQKVVTIRSNKVTYPEIIKFNPVKGDFRNVDAR